MKQITLIKSNVTYDVEINHIIYESQFLYWILWQLAPKVACMVSIIWDLIFRINSSVDFSWLFLKQNIPISLLAWEFQGVPTAVTVFELNFPYMLLCFMRHQSPPGLKPVLPFISWVTLNKLPDTSVPQFPLMSLKRLLRITMAHLRILVIQLTKAQWRLNAFILQNS